MADPAANLLPRVELTALGGRLVAHFVAVAKLATTDSARRYNERIADLLREACRPDAPLTLICCEVREATHVKLADGTVERIVSSWGIDGGKLAKMRDGGFGVVTESGARVGMMEAHSYFREQPR